MYESIIGEKPGMEGRNHHFYERSQEGGFAHVVDNEETEDLELFLNSVLHLEFVV